MSISCCFTSAYDKLSFVVRLSIMFSWCLTKKSNKRSLLALSSLRNVAKVFWYELEDAFERFVRWSDCDSNLDINTGKSVPEYWVGRETRFIIWETSAKAESLQYSVRSQVHIRWGSSNSTIFSTMSWETTCMNMVHAVCLRCSKASISDWSASSAGVTPSTTTPYAWIPFRTMFSEALHNG